MLPSKRNIDGGHCDKREYKYKYEIELLFTCIFLWRKSEQRVQCFLWGQEGLVVGRIDFIVHCNRPFEKRFLRGENLVGEGVLL